MVADIVPSDLAVWKPFDNKGTTPLQHDIVCVHTMVGSLPGSYSWANQPGNSYWHFGIAGSGETWQCQDLRYRSAANLEGNPYVIPIETADHGSPFAEWSGQCGDVPAWTDAQVDKLIALIAWLCVRYDIPPELIPDTTPGRRGLAYHRQGVPGSPEWVTGNLKWSTSVGKCCPDWRRINQFKNEVVPGVRALVEDDMPYTRDELLAIVERGVWNAVAKGGSAEASFEKRVEEAVEAALQVKDNKPGLAVDQMHARVRDGVKLALDDLEVQSKLRTVLGLATEVPPVG